MALVDNFDEVNRGSVSSLSDSSSFMGLQKVQPILVRWNRGTPATGNTYCDFSVSITSKDELVVTEGDEDTVRDYQIPYFNSTAEEAVIWVYGSWDSDSSNQAVVACGTGDGTNYAWNGPYSSSGTGTNPWTGTGINAGLVYLLDESTNSTYFDSSGNNLDATTITGTTVEDRTDFGYGVLFDATDDHIQYPATGVFGTDVYTVAGYVRTSATLSTSNYITHPRDETDTNIRGNSGALEHSFYDGSSVKAVSSGSFASGDFISYIARFETSTTHRIRTNSSTDSVTPSSVANNVASVNQLGERIDGNGNLWDGHMYNFRVYDDNKSDEWELADYDATPEGGQNFFYWGGVEDVQTYTTSGESTYDVSNLHSITVSMEGASGGFGNDDQGGAPDGGAGGFSSGTINVKNIDTVYIHVGGSGGSSNVSSGTDNGGYNGGGTAWTNRSNGLYGGGGGGASDISLASSPGTFESPKRVMVAGGGGGGGWQSSDGDVGGDGGGTTGGDGGGGSLGATQTGGYDFWQGADLNDEATGGAAGGGGGGWYGGNFNFDAGGGGGSGYLSNRVSNGVLTQGGGAVANSNDGSVTIESEVPLEDNVGSVRQGNFDYVMETTSGGVIKTDP